MSSLTANTKSREPLTPSQVARGMRFSIWDALFSQPFYGLTWPTSVFVTGLAIILGANPFEIGLIAALGPLLSGLNLVAARIIEKNGNRKKLYVPTAFVHRSVFLLLLLLPFLMSFLPHKTGIVLLILVVFLSTVFGTFQGTAWLSWMADLVPDEKRGAFFGKRNMLAGGLWMGLSYIAGWYVDVHKTIWGYSIVFSVGTVLALIAISITARVPEPPLAINEEQPSLLQIWKSIYAFKAFRFFLIFQVLWSFTTSLAAPFYNVYMIQSLQFDIARITIFGIIGGIIGTATMPYWGLLGDKAGNKSTLLFCLTGSCLTAFGWLMITPQNKQWVIPIMFALGGFFDTGAGLTGFNMLFGILPEKNKPTSIAFYQAIVGTLAGISPVIGGFLALKLQHFHIPFVNAEPVLLVIGLSTILRLIPLVFLTRIPKQQGHGLSFVVTEFVLANPIKLFTSLYLAQKNPNKKLAAINNLSHMKSKAALPELVVSIHDIDPRIRKRAVAVLGEIGDATILDSLIKALDDPLEDIQGEAALSIGKLGYPIAIEPLLRKLEQADSYLQSCIATALGDLKADQAVDVLLALVTGNPRTSVLLACTDALGRIGNYKAVDPLMEISRSVSAPTIKHALIASVAALVDENGELYRALIQPDVNLSTMGESVLTPDTVKFARSRQSPLRTMLIDAQKAFNQKNFNEVVVQLKLLNQYAVREYLARKELKDVLGFEQWVWLLDSTYTTQLEAVQKINNKVGIALTILDYYARHCPVAVEPDIDKQELLLALYAFKQAQEGLYAMVNGHNFVEERVLDRLKDLSQRLLKT